MVDRPLKFQMNSRLCVVSMTLLLVSFHMSGANDCAGKPDRCPDYIRARGQCYCPGEVKVKLACENGQWKPLPCDLSTTTQPTPAPRCPDLQKIPFATLKYTPPVHDQSGHLPGTIATYMCDGSSKTSKTSKTYQLTCDKDSWNKKIPQSFCSCDPPQKYPWQTIRPDKPGSRDDKSGRYKLGSIIIYSCNTTQKEVGVVSCQNGKWHTNRRADPNACAPPALPTTARARTKHKTKKALPTTARRQTIIVDKPRKATSSVQHTEERTVVIVSGTTGAILGALIILVTIVSCQRRLHYHRMRRARQRHRQDQDAFTAFITYHRDVRLMLPSYDEAINQQEQGQPPSYEEPTLPPGDTPAGENPPSISTDSPTSSVSAASDTRSSPEGNSDTGTLICGRSSASPTSEDSRFFRNLRALFGGRAFRPDAIYCRFVPEENGDESSTRTEERESRNNSNTDADLSEVLTQAGLY